MQNFFTEPMNSNFEIALNQGLNGNEENFDLYKEERLEKLEFEYTKRNGAQPIAPDNALSPQFVIQQAAERYFDFVNDAMNEIQGIFTEEEFRIILNCTNTPLISWQHSASFANMVADELGIEALDDLPDGTIKALLLKLLELKNAQSLALTDLCETYWRAPQSGSLREISENLGMKLADET